MIDWFHFLLHEDGRSLYEDSSGNISSSASPVKIQKGPDAWKDIAIGYERDDDAIGLVKTFSFPLKFVRDGAKILRTIMYTAGAEFKLFYRAAFRTVEVIADVIPIIKDYHKFFFRGQVNLSSAKDGENDVTLTIGPIGLERNLAAFKDTIYEFPLSHALAENIETDGIKLYSTANFQAPAQVEYDDALYRHDHTPGFGYTTVEGRSFGIAVFNQLIGGITGLNFGEFVASSTNYFITNDVTSAPVTITLKGKLIVRITKRDIPGSVRFWWRSNLGQVIDIPGNASTLDGNTILPVDQQLTLAPGENFFLTGRVFGTFPTGAIGFKYVFMEGSDIEIKWGNRGLTTYIRGFSLFNILELVITAIGGKSGQVISELLTTNPYKNIWLTSGDGVRGLPDAVVKISFKMLWQIIKVNCFAGYSIENGKLNVRTVPKYFDNSYPSDQVIDLGEAKNCDITFSQDKMYNEVEVGHQDKNIEGVNGKYRFNTVHQYSSKRTSEKKKLSLISPAIADPYIIEHLRLNFDGKKTTDSSEDNDLVIIHGERTTTDALVAIATRKNPLTLASGGVIVSFEEFNNIGLVPNTGYTEFTWTGANPINVVLHLYLTPKSIPTPGISQTTTIRKNGITIATAIFDADGNTTTDIGYTGPLNPGDIISIFTTCTTSINILSAQMTVSFDDLPIVKIFRETYDSLAGVPDDTVFNIFFTPKRTLKRWMKFINSCFYKMDGTLLTYQTSDRNSDLRTEKAGVVVDEDADEPITVDIIFKTLYFDVESLVPIDLADQLDNKPNVPFKFIWLNVQPKGFLMKGGTAMSDRKSQVIKLLCSPDFDETKYIR